MAYSIGKISGCHVNPAVSFAMFVDGKLSGQDLCGYTVAQCLGALIGGALLWPFAGRESGLGANGLYDGSVMKSVLIEIILTYIFVTAIFGATEKLADSHVAGIVIGLSLTLVHLLGIAYTGTSVNPARSLGPALIVGGEALRSVGVFIVGPLAGALLAALVWRYLYPKKN